MKSLADLLLNDLGIDASIVIVGGGVLGAYRTSTRLYSQTIGSRRDLARRINQLAAGARPFQDHDVSPRMVNGRMERPAHRVASVMSARPARRSAPIAGLRRVAMTLGPDRVLTWDLSSWHKVSRSQ